LDEATMLSERVGVMSARPGCFIDIIETGWPRDRDSRIATLPEFGAVTGRLWDLLREESIKAMRQEGRGDDANLLIVTHTAREDALAKTVASLSAMTAVRKVASVMRVEAEDEE